MLEAKVEDYFVKCAAAAGYLQRKIAYIGRRHATDRLLIAPGGLVFFVELKRPDEDARPGQAREHNRLREMGCRVHVLATLEAVNEFFQEVLREVCSDRTR